MKTLFTIILTGILGYILTAQEVTFTKITTGDLVNDGGWSYSMLWMDFNHDNFPDLYVTNNDSNNGQLNLLYMNNGDGTFTKITEGPVVNDGGSSYSCSAAEVNGDGNPDLFVANYNENNFLYFGNGDGTFEKVTTGPMVTNGGKSVGAAWADYNMDGWLDLYVANRDQQNFLYKGLGNGEFEKITTGAIVTDIANSSGCAWGDYDNDGYPDLYVANSGTVSNLYHNNGDETFTKVNEEPFITDVSSCAGASWGDCDNDGDLDLFVSTGQLGMYVNWFYLNDGDGTFTKVTDSPLVNEATWSSGSAWGDYDKDGDLDLAVGGYDGPNLLFKNDGAGNFEKVLNNSFVNNRNYTEGLAWADADNDGDLDIFTAKNNYFGGNNSFFLNDGNNNNWLKLKLEGDQLYHNIQALGAKVFVYATIFGQPVMQMREVATQTGGGQGGQNDVVQFFGLGDAAVVDSVIVRWLFNEFKQSNVSVNQTIDMGLIISGVSENHSEKDFNLSVFPNPASDQINLNFTLTNNTLIQIRILGVNGKLLKTIHSGEIAKGNHNLILDLKNAENIQLVPGIYFIQLVSESNAIVKKIMVLAN
jgi:enediyne biosynthesis protein E4